MLRYGWFRTGHRFPNGHNLCLSRHSPLDSSDDRSVVCTHCGHGREVVLPPQAINQSAFPRTQHLLWQREKISKRPNQIRALHEIRLYVSRPDRRVQFNDAITEFFNPHDLPTWKRRPTPPLLLKRAIIAPLMGQCEVNFRGGRIYFHCLDQIEKKPPDGGLALSTIPRPFN